MQPKVKLHRQRSRTACLKLPDLRFSSLQTESIESPQYKAGIMS